MIPPFQVRTAGLTKNNPYHSTPGTRQNDIMLTVFLAGQGYYQNTAGRRTIEPHTVGLVDPIDPGVLMADPSDPYTHYYCRFNGPYAVHLARTIVKARRDRFFFVPDADQVADRIHRMGPIYRTELPGCMGHAEVLLAETLVLLAQPAQTASSTFSLPALEQYLLDHLTEPHDLARIADHFHLSKASLCRLARKHTRSTVVRVSESMKMDWAKTLLETGGLSVAEVARRVGYRDPFYFSRVFKKHIGRNPKAWTR